MTQEKYLEHIEKFFKAGLEITRKKNTDYAGLEDAFRNFRNSAVVGVDMKRGVLVRIMDKISRITNLLDRPPEVKDESIQDALMDTAVYCGILSCMLEDKNTMIVK